MQQFYSNGKLLLTGEYYVLDGAKALALPVRRGQDMVVRQKLASKVLHWYSLDDQANCWLQVVIELPQLIVKTSFGPTEKLQILLQTALELNPDFIKKLEGAEVITQLSFPRNWGLGSSSTLVNNLAQWAEVNPYKLLEASFGGSGYDIACAQTDSPIVYQKSTPTPLVKECSFDPTFSDALHFVHLTKKQSSIDAIRYYLKHRSQHKTTIGKLDQITEELLTTDSLSDFEKLMDQHETIVSQSLQLPKVKDLHFPDYWGTVKSLGAWGGDFVLVSSRCDQQETQSYFRDKGFTTFIPWKRMVPSLKTSS